MNNRNWTTFSAKRLAGIYMPAVLFAFPVLLAPQPKGAERKEIPS